MVKWTPKTSQMETTPLQQSLTELWVKWAEVFASSATSTSDPAPPGGSQVGHMGAQGALTGENKSCSMSERHRLLLNNMNQHDTSIHLHHHFVCIGFTVIRYVSIFNCFSGPGIAGVLAFCEHLGASFVPLGKPACGRMRPPQWHVCSTMHIFSESIRHHVSLCGFAHRGVCTNTLVWCHYCTVWQILILKVCVLDIARPLWVAIAAWLEIVSAGFVLDSKNQPHLALSFSQHGCSLRHTKS